MWSPSPAGLVKARSRHSGPAARCGGTKDGLGLQRLSQRQLLGAGAGDVGLLRAGPGRGGAARPGKASQALRGSIVPAHHCT